MSITYKCVLKVAAIDPWWEGAVLNLPGYPERFEVTRGVPNRLMNTSNSAKKIRRNGRRRATAVCDLLAIAFMFLE